MLVTGAAGFIGSHLAGHLATADHEIVAVDDLSTGRADDLLTGIELLEIDVSDEQAVGGIDGPFDAICHLAGQSSGERSFDDPLADFDRNARSTVVLASWALRRRIPVLVHASSMAVYGIPDRLPVPESAPCVPLSYYGVSKLCAERVLQLTSAQGVRCVSLRMFSVYGPGQNLQNLRQGMASIYLAHLLRGEPIVVKGRLDRCRDLVYIDDVVRAWDAALNTPVSGAFNVGTGRGTTVGKLLDELRSVFGSPDHPIEEAGGTPGDQHAIYADVKAARRELGWEPSVELRNGLERMVAWASSEVK